jgi:hypothetical protein
MNQHTSFSALTGATSLDCDMYLIECRTRDGSVVFAERDAERTGRKDTLADIHAGQVDDVTRVYAFNPVEGWSRDVSEDFARDLLAAELADNSTVSPHIINFIEWHLGCATVATAERELVA